MEKIKSCIIWTNGMIFSFDEKGEHVQECEGFILDIAEKLKNNCDENTKWEFGKWAEWIEDAKLGWHWEKNRDRTGYNNKTIE